MFFKGLSYVIKTKQFLRNYQIPFAISTYLKTIGAMKWVQTINIIKKGVCYSNILFYLLFNFRKSSNPTLITMDQLPVSSKNFSGNKIVIKT